MYSKFFCFKVCARTTRAIVTQLVNPIAIIIDTRPGFNTSNINTRMIKFGIAEMISKKRCITVSTRPPNHPEIIPYVTPIVISNNAATKAIISDVCVPYSTRENKSRPRLSVPKKKFTPSGTPCCAYTSTPLRYPLKRPGIRAGKFANSVFCSNGSNGAMTGAKNASNTITRIIKSDTKAPLFFVNRLHESCKKLREGAAIFSRSALCVKSTRWNNSFSVNSAITLPLLHQ